ncbi:MAG TPA: HXXEE domain-containing protein [Puia sp.]|nr:HXXEE domain-containing protein [Puia sp.]
MKSLFGFPEVIKPWTWFDMIWPWIGLFAAFILVVLLFATNIFRQNLEQSRWRDTKWLSWLAIPIYMIHEFEEYGIDFLGNKHAFPDGLCQNLNLGDYPFCSIPHEFYLYVNIPLVWIFAVIAAVLSSKNPFVGLGLYSVIISNAFAHIFTFFLRHEYNPGLITAILIFLLSFIWISRACFGIGRISKKGILVLIGTGIILHAILISSIFAFINQKIESTTLDLIQAVNAATIIVFPWLGDKLLGIYNKAET